MSPLTPLTPRRRARYTTLPGGALLTFDGFLPPRTCPHCGLSWPAADYVKAVVCVNLSRWLRFGLWCLRCDAPEALPLDLHGVRPTSTYLDDEGRTVGWQQRTSAGLFGPVLALETMGMRQTADGVYRPQPKLDRRSTRQQRAHPSRGLFA